MYQTQDGGHLFAVAFNAVVRAIDGTRVLDGGSVTHTGDHEVDVGAVEYTVGGTEYSSTGGTVTISTVTDGARYTTVTATDAGSLNTIDGTVDSSEEPKPPAPNPPSDEVALAVVRVTEDGVEGTEDVRALMPPSYSDEDAADAAPVQSVDGRTGDVESDQRSDGEIQNAALLMSEGFAPEFGG